MILIEVNPVATAVLPIDQMKSHLRLGSGFAEDAVQDDVVESYLRAALAAVEGRTGQAIFEREFVWSVDKWTSTEAQSFPLAPVKAIASITKVEVDGTREDQSLSDFTFVEDVFAPKLRALGGALPEPPSDGKIEVALVAGSAQDWSQVPSDLAQAVLLLAAHYYEYREDLALGKGCTPFGVTALLERYRPMRIGFGGRS